MLNDLDAAHLAAIRARTEATLREAIGDAREVAIIDAPNQRNIGDSLIWEGELAYLRRLGCTIRYVSDIRCFDARLLRRKLSTKGVVLLHGGGNFGDLWVGHQEHRERVVAALPEYRIVQLSQSIYFSNEERAAEANARLAKHDDFLVLIRDNISLERAGSYLPDIRVQYCPDMALGWGPPQEFADSYRPTEIIAIARADREAASGLRDVPTDWIAGHQVRVTDWGLHAKDPLGWRFARLILRLQHILIAGRRKTGIPVPQFPQAVAMRMLRKTNSSNVESALQLYSSAEALIVDRLHAHVLSMLLGIQHVLLDNNYRKLGGVFEDYTGVFSTAHYCTSVTEAREVLTGLVPD